MNPTPMHKRIYRFVPVLAIAVATLVPTSAQAHESACGKLSCAVEFKASPALHRWSSPQRFGHVEVFISLFVEGRRVHKELVEEGCGAVWSGRGVIVRAEVCGSGAVPIRISYRATGPEEPRMMLVYESS